MISRLCRRLYDDYLNATEQADIDRHFHSAQSAQRTSLVAAGLTLGFGIAWKALADRLRWSPRSPSTEISLRPTTGDFYVQAADSDKPYLFSTKGQRKALGNKERHSNRCLSLLRRTRRNRRLRADLRSLFPPTTNRELGSINPPWMESSLYLWIQQD